MNIFIEISRRITTSMKRYLFAPADHERPQDDVPDERVTLRVVADYQRMYNERQALIDYIRHMECIYKDAQVTLFGLVTKPSLPTRKRMMTDIKIMLFDITKYHLEAQKQLRKDLGMADEQETNNNEQN